VFLEAAYSNLANTAQLLQWPVCITIDHWLQAIHESVETCLRSLHECHAEFAFMVNVKQSRMLKEARESGENYDLFAHKKLLNSYVFHEHRILSEDACRQRIKDKAHVFAEIIEACSKDEVAMLEEQLE
jgi:hypothetical protein